MKKYKIKNKICLSFLTPRDQCELMFEPDVGFHLEVGQGRLGETIWAISEKTGEKLESITTSNFIDFALKRGDIEELS
jgi:hypothetical protein